MPQLHLQLALDHCTLDEAVHIAALAAPWVDTVEVGTPLLMRAGCDAIAQVGAAIHNHTCTLFADTKISDEGAAIARTCFEAGADAVSVIDGARTATLRGVRATANEFGGKAVWVDLLHDANPVIRARALAPYVDGFIIHRPESGLPRLLIEALLAVDRPLRLAGGVTLDHAEHALRVHYTAPWRRSSIGAMEGIIVGRAITEADDQEAALRAFAELCRGGMKDEG